MIRNHEPQHDVGFLDINSLVMKQKYGAGKGRSSPSEFCLEERRPGLRRDDCEAVTSISTWKALV